MDNWIWWHRFRFSNPLYSFTHWMSSLQYIYSRHMACYLWHDELMTILCSLYSPSLVMYSPFISVTNILSNIFFLIFFIIWLKFIWISINVGLISHLMGFFPKVIRLIWILTNHIEYVRNSMLVTFIFHTYYSHL